MKEDEIRKRYQREDAADLRGINIGAMDRFIEMLNVHEKSEDSRIKDIAENFEYIDKLAPNFVIFEAKDCFFMHVFKAYQISRDTDMLVAAHEFGHSVLSIMNNTQVPDNYGDIIVQAKQHALAPENIEYFKDYVQYLAGKTDKKDDRTKGEKGPVSDIMSSIFQLEGLRINTKDNVCIFPSFHRRTYYFDEEKGEPKLDKIFDEDFANYYSLKVNNCAQEIETVRALFGDEFVQVLDGELEKVCERLREVKESELSGKPKTAIEQIKGIVTATREGEIETINPLEKVAEIEAKKSEEK